MHRTGSFAFSAPYALSRIDILRALDLHRTGLFTLEATDALGFVQLHLIEAESGEQSVDRPQRTKVSAERSMNKSRGNHDNQQKAHLPAEQEPDYAFKYRICKYQRNSGHRSCRADKSAEPGFTHVEVIPDQYRKQYDQHSQNHILQISENLVRLLIDLDFLYRNLMKQVLDKTERAEESAYQPAQYKTEQHDQPQHIEAEPVLAAADDCLQRSYRT